MNEAPLLQSGRARLDYLVSVSRGLGRLFGRVNAQVDALDVTTEQLPDDLDERDAFICGKLEGSDAFYTADALQSYLGTEHGKVARDAFEAMAPSLLPSLKALEEKGPATLTIDR